VNNGAGDRRLIADFLPLGPDRDPAAGQCLLRCALLTENYGIKHGIYDLVIDSKQYEEGFDA
jgi:hypothetical protein